VAAALLVLFLMSGAFSNLQVGVRYQQQIRDAQLAPSSIPPLSSLALGGSFPLSHRQRFGSASSVARNIGRVANLSLQVRGDRVARPGLGPTESLSPPNRTLMR